MAMHSAEKVETTYALVEAVRSVLVIVLEHECQSGLAAQLRLLPVVRDAETAENVRSAASKMSYPAIQARADYATNVCVHLDQAALHSISFEHTGMDLHANIVASRLVQARADAIAAGVTASMLGAAAGP